MSPLTIHAPARSLAVVKPEVVSISVYPSHLTVKEVAIIQMLADGLILKEIAAEFRTSFGYVKNMVQVIRRKVGARTNPQVVAWAFNNKVLG